VCVFLKFSELINIILLNFKKCVIQPITRLVYSGVHPTKQKTNKENELGNIKTMIRGTIFGMGS
jgi:hypothetical protein